MSGHPIYYPWQGRAPQPPSLPTHSFNPWQPRAHKLRPPASPPSPPPPRFPRGGSPTGAVEGFSPGSGGIAGVGGQDPPTHTHFVGRGSGSVSPPSSSRPCSGTWWAPRRARPGPAATSAVLCRGGQPTAAGARLGSVRNGTAAAPTPGCVGGKAGILPAHGRSRCRVGFPASGLLRGRGVWCGVVWCCPHAGAVPPGAFWGSPVEPRSFREIEVEASAAKHELVGTTQRRYWVLAQSFLVKMQELG